MTLSNSQVDRAGQRIRAHVRDGRPPLDEDLAVVEAFRELYLPISVGLQNMLNLIRERYTAEVAKLGDEASRLTLPITIASRPKTAESIVAKLARSTIRLSLMQDIAGGRIVVPSLRIQNAVLEGLLEGYISATGSEPTVKDTREAGDELGYRGLHVILS